MTVQIDNYPLRRFFIKPCPFIYFEQMLLLMLSKETGEWCIVYNGITIFLFPSSQPFVYLATTAQNIGVWSHAYNIAR